jgi:DNA-binding NarL/FixJ family response regulator
VTRVLLVDDQDLVRAGFRLILEVEDDLWVAGEARDGVEAVSAVEALQPDVVIMDVQMPGGDGLTATRHITATTGTPVLVLTTFDRDDYLFGALEAGASGFLLKNAAPEGLVEAVRVVARGDALLAPEVTRRVLARFSARPGRAARPDLAAGLSERERQVLLLVAQGLSNAEIAERLVVGEATVKTHVSRVLDKLGVRDRLQAVVHAYETGLVHPAGDQQDPPRG